MTITVTRTVELEVERNEEKGDMDPPELKIELNLMATYTNDEYTHLILITMALLKRFGTSAMA
eukprot:8970608-Ditylum_brightwellii.AAC.1